MFYRQTQFFPMKFQGIISADILTGTIIPGCNGKLCGKTFPGLMQNNYKLRSAC